MATIQEFQDVPQLTLDQLNLDIEKGTVSVKSASLRPVLIVAYANYCGYCHRFGPMFKRLSQAVSGPVHVMAFHGPDESLLKAVLGVKAYPTIMMIDRQGQIHVFENEREMTQLLSFVRAHM